jgi:hypothetical protein
MNTLEKEFVPYQPSLDMKELGFDEPCLGWWFADEEMLIIEKSTKSTSENIIQAPTFSQAFKWFREKHNLMFQIFYLRNGNHAVLIHRTTPEYMDLVDQIRPSGCVDEVVDCYSYEEAELACLDKLIEIVKEKKNG